MEVDLRRHLSRRERQILDVVYRLGEATVADVRDQIPDPPGYDSVRTTMRLLEEKDMLHHRRDGQRYVYRAAVEKNRAQRGALIDLVKTFFDGSAEAAALALLSLEREDVAESEIERLRSRLDEIADDSESKQS
jgi:BlaI family transcriptional regulator, penicillinase repressor